MVGVLWSLVSTVAAWENIGENKNILDLMARYGPFYVEFACPPLSAWVITECSGIYPQSKDMQLRIIDGCLPNSVGVNEGILAVCQPSKELSKV